LEYPQPTPIPTQISTPIPSSTITPIPTPNNLVINPSSGIIINELMPNSNIEWVEIKNTNNFPVKLVNWKIKDAASNIKDIPEIIINAHDFYVHDNLSRFLNDNEETINLVDNKNQIVFKTEYKNIGYTTGKSFSNVSGSWCLADELLLVTKNLPLLLNRFHLQLLLLLLLLKNLKIQIYTLPVKTIILSL